VDENGIYTVTEEEAAEFGLEGTENFNKAPIPHDVDAGSTNAGSTNQEADIIVTPDMVKDKVQQGARKAMVVGLHQVSEWGKCNQIPFVCPLHLHDYGSPSVHFRYHR
jgi:hypothetical protein